MITSVVQWNYSLTALLNLARVSRHLPMQVLSSYVFSLPCTVDASLGVKNGVDTV